MPPDDPHVRPDEDTHRFRRTLVRVMAVQIVSLIALWLLQTHYSG